MRLPRTMLLTLFVVALPVSLAAQSSIVTGSSNSGSGGGSVNSVSATVPSFMSVTGSPITDTGTLDFTFGSQAQGLSLMAPCVGAGLPVFRAICAADVPALAASQVTGTALTAANNLSDLASASAARTSLGLGTLATQSGTFSGTSSGANTGDQVVPANTTSTTSQWFAAYNSSTGVFTKSQPAFSDISGSLAHSQLPTLLSGDIPNNAANTSGSAATLTTPRTINGDSFDGSGNIQNTLASSDFANQGTTTTILHGNAAGNPAFGSVVNADITANTIDVATKLTGTLLAAQEPARTGDATNSTGSLAMTVGKVNGVAYAASPSTDTVPVITAANTATYSAVPNCTDATGNHLNYTASTHTISCGTSSSGGFTPPTGTGAVTVTSGSLDAASTAFSGTGSIAKVTQPTFVTDFLTPKAYIGTGRTSSDILLEIDPSNTSTLAVLDGTISFVRQLRASALSAASFHLGTTFAGVRMAAAANGEGGFLISDASVYKSLSTAGVYIYGASNTSKDTNVSRLAAGVISAGAGSDLSQSGWFVDARTSRVATQFDATLNTTLANVAGLSVSVLAGRTYSFDATLYTTSNVAGGIQAAIAGTATATNVIYEGYNINGATLNGQTRATSLGTAVAATTAVTSAMVKIFGTITVNAAGTLTVQFAQNTTNAAASSVLVGSVLVVTPH